MARREQPGSTFAMRRSFRMGPGGVVYLLVTALLAGAAWYTQANLLFWSVGLLIGGLGMSALWAWRSLRHLEVSRLLPSHAVAGEMMAVRYHIVNRSRLPYFSVTIHETWGVGRGGHRRVGPTAEKPAKLGGRPMTWLMHLGPGQATQAEAICWPRLRCDLAFESIVLGTSFPFGVIRAQVRIDMPARVLVYPHLYRLNRQLLHTLSRSDPSGRRQVERAGGSDEFFGLRHYRAGDSLRYIDWKRTARTGQLVAREMTHPSPPRIMIMLDLRETASQMPQQATDDQSSQDRPLWKTWHRLWGKRPRSEPDAPSLGQRRVDQERAISLTASMVCDAYLHGYQVGLVVAGPVTGVFPIHHSLPHRTRMLEALARLQLTQEMTYTPGAQPAEPSVVIHAGHADATGPAASSMGHHAPLHMGAADLERYVRDADPASILSRRVLETKTKSRRQQKAQELPAVAIKPQATGSERHDVQFTSKGADR